MTEEKKSATPASPRPAATPKQAAPPVGPPVGPADNRATLDEIAATVRPEK